MARRSQWETGQNGGGEGRLPGGLPAEVAPNGPLGQEPLWSAPRPLQVHRRVGVTGPGPYVQQVAPQSRDPGTRLLSHDLRRGGSRLREAGAGEGLQEAARVQRSFGVWGGVPKADGGPLGGCVSSGGLVGPRSPDPQQPGQTQLLHLPGACHQALVTRPGCWVCPVLPAVHPLPLPGPQVTSPGWGRRRAPGVWQEGGSRLQPPGPSLPGRTGRVLIWCCFPHEAGPRARQESSA